MMLDWMFYIVVVSIFLSIAAYSAERAALVRKKTIRWYWLIAIITSLLLPTLTSSVSIEMPVVSNVSPAQEKKIVLKDVTSKYLSPAIWVSGSFIENTRLKKDGDLVKQIWVGLSLIMLMGLLLSAAQLLWRKKKWRRKKLLETSVFQTEATGPALVGLIHPEIVVPAWVFDLPIEQQKAIIAHEKSHLDAGDPLLLTIALSLLVFMPWNIPLWWQLYRLRRAIEIDCDRRVLKGGQNLDDYGETLVLVGARNSGFIGAVAGMAESNSFLESRLTIMLTKKIQWWRSIATAMAILSFGFVAMAAQVSPPNSDVSEHLEQSIISLSAPELEKYTGNFRLGESKFITVFEKEGQLFAQLLGRRPMAIFPTSSTDFVSKLVKATYTFEFDEQEQATGLVWHKGGREMPALRMLDSDADVIKNELAQRIAYQLPKPNSEAALRRLITGLISGEPDYSRMSAVIEKATKEQLPELRAGAIHLGELQRIEFRKVGNEGWDMFDTYHENGSATWRINVNESDVVLGVLVNAGP